MLKKLRENIDTRLFINIVNKQTDIESLDIMSMLIEKRKIILNENNKRTFIKGYKRYDKEEEK